MKYEEAAEYKELELKGWVCKTCGRFWGKDEHMARFCCCTSNLCACGEHTRSRSYAKCDKCIQEQINANEKERFDNAEKVTDWAGPVYNPVDNDYYESLEVMVEELIDNSTDGPELNVPDYVWCCKAIPVALDADRVLECLTEDISEEAYDNLEGVEDFCKAVKMFNEANKNSGGWDTDYTKALVIDKEDVQKQYIEVLEMESALGYPE